MPRFYFDVESDGVRAFDDLGLEFATAEIARAEAALAAAAMVKERVNENGARLDLHMCGPKREPLFHVRASITVSPARPD